MGLTLLGCSKKQITAPDATAPVIALVSATPDVVGRGESALLCCSAQDPDGDNLSYSWSTTAGSFLAVGGDSATKGFSRWKAPDTVATVTVTVTASDNRGKSAQKLVAITMTVYRLVSFWGSQGSGAGQFTSPCGIAVGPTGSVYVTDAGNNRIEKFDANGTFLRQWIRGDGDNDTTHPNLKNPRGIAADRLGYVYVVDNGNKRVQKFFDSGTSILYIQSYKGVSRDTFGSPNGVSVTPSLDFYVTDYDTIPNGRVWKFPYSGTPTHWPAVSPGGVAADGFGYVYVPSSGGNRVQVFGTWTGEFGTPGDSIAEFNGPYGAATDDSGNVFITDTGNNRVEECHRNTDNSFSYRTQFGSLGIGPNQFNCPLGIALGVNGDYSVYVMDAGNCQVKKFSAK